MTDRKAGMIVTVNHCEVSNLTILHVDEPELIAGRLATIQEQNFSHVNAA